MIFKISVTDIHLVLLYLFKARTSEVILTVSISLLTKGFFTFNLKIIFHTLMIIRKYSQVVLQDHTGFITYL